MNLKRFTIAIVSIVVFAAAVKLVIACADLGDPADMYVSFFQNNITGQPQYKPFYFTDFSPLYEENYFYGSMPEDDVMPDGNIEEWYTYCKKTAKRKDIDSFMNKYSYKEVKALADNKQGVPADLKSNSFAKFLMQDKNKDALDYLLYAKKCEPLVTDLSAYWDETKKKYSIDTTPRRNLIAEGVSKNAKTKNDFLKWRYAYQPIRLAMYCRDNVTTLRLYDKMIGAKTANNMMYPRCLGLKAGALYRTGKKKTAAYLYSKAFDLSDDMKRNAFLSFVWVTDSIKISDLQSLCKNNHEKAVLVVMDGLYERSGEGFEGLKLMQKAYSLDPNVGGLSIVMTREINKAEQRYLQERESMERSLNGSFDAYYSFDADYARKKKDDWKKEKSKYKKYLADLNSFAQKVAKDKKTKDKAFWELASSYIYFIQDKFPDCKKQLELAAKEKMNAHERDVHDIINILCIVHKGGKLTPETEAELLPAMQTVEKRASKSIRFAKTYRDLLSTILTDKYMEQKDTVRALYCQARVTRDNDGEFIVSDDFTDIPGSLVENMSIDKLHEVQAFVQKSDKTDFEAWLTYNTPYPVGVLKELEGTKYIRELNFEKAVAVLSSVPKDVLAETTLPDILISHLQDSQEWNKSDSAKTYNKLEFAKKMLDLKKILDKQPNNGRIAYQYANGIYNMSYYGRAHHAFDYYHSTGDDNAYFATASRKKLPAYKRDYYELATALKYYLVACTTMSDPEMKARCLFLAAKCWQKNCPVPAGKNKYDLNGDKTYYQYSITNPYFSSLYRQYRNTKLYTEAFGSCAYFRDYVHKN